MCSGYWTSYAIVLFVWCTLFAINIYLKDQTSYKFKSGWETYKKQSYSLLPKIFPTDLLNIVFYAGFFGVIAFYSGLSVPLSIQ